MSNPVLRYKHNRIQQLRGFCYAASTGSFSEAASRMLLTQPAVSQQIKSLETEWDIRLFSRRGGRMELTSDGELLFQLARPLIDELDTLEDKFRQQRLALDEGQLDIAAGLSTILYFLPRYVEAFRRSYPRIELRLQQVTGLDGLERLRHGLVDFAVGPLLHVPDDIEFHPIATYEAVVITPPGHPLVREKQLSLEQLSRYPMILPPRNLSTWPIVDSTFKRHGLSYHVAMQVGGWEAIKTYVQLGIGISVIPRIGITREDNLEVLAAGNLFPERTYGAVLLKRKPLTQQAKRFVNLLLGSPDTSGSLLPEKGLIAKDARPALT